MAADKPCPQLQPSLAPKVKKYALNSQLQALQILTNDDEVEN
jgi:hypothetical protein